MGFVIEHSQREDSQAHGEDVGDAAALGAHDVFGLSVAVDVELHGGCAAFEIAFDFERDGLLEDFLQSEGEVVFDDLGDFAEEFLA